MSGIFDIDLVMNKKPVGHGYVEGKIFESNPFFDIGTVFKGHEFHYSGLADIRHDYKTCIKLTKGVGLGNYIDGLQIKNCIACYSHIHADGMKDWAKSFVSRTIEYKKNSCKIIAGDSQNNKEVLKTI